MLFIMAAHVFADSNTYLNFTAINNPATIEIKKTGTPYSLSLMYSIDSCTTWTIYNLGHAIRLNVGEKVYFKAFGHGLQNGGGKEPHKHYYYFSITGGKMAADGNIMSLLDSTMQQNSVPNYAFIALFRECDSLISAPELPATEVGIGGYKSMFVSCSSLTKAPKLPAMRISEQSYSNMFDGCISLTEAPKLPATQLAENCYEWMFSECNSLVKAPELPARDMKKRCYFNMFSYCQSLTEVPDLHAVNMAEECCRSMFESCSTLVYPPALPAKSTSSHCYAEMFEDCISLIRLPELPATYLADKCYFFMFSGCTSLRINNSSPGAEWKIPSNAVEKEKWNERMFKYTGGNFTDNPVKGTTYYVASDKTSGVDDVTDNNVVDDNDIVLAPNPVAIGENSYMNATEEILGIEIYNSEGCCVRRMEQLTENAIVNGLPSAGTYFIRITTISGKRYTRKLIVQ